MVTIVQLLNRYENFILRLDIALERFPSNQKYSLRTKIDNESIMIWGKILEVQTTKNNKRKIFLIKKVKEQIVVLEAFLRLAKKRGFLGYVTCKDMKAITKNKDISTWQRKLTSIEEKRHNEKWMKNAEMEYVKLTKMLGEIVTLIDNWLKK